MVNVPIPLLDVGVKLPLKDNVCSLLMDIELVLTVNDFQLPSLSTQYSHALIDNFAVKPSSNASMVKYSE